MVWLHRSKADSEGKPSRVYKRRGILTVLLVLISAAIILAGVAALFYRLKLFGYRKLLMDTDVSVQLYSGTAVKAGRIRNELFVEMERLERLLSYTNPSSDVTKINGAAGEKSVQVSPETAEVIQYALHYAELCEGAYDPTIAPLLEIWGFLGGRYHVPSPEEMGVKRSLVDYTLVELDGAEGKVFLPQPGMALDLGGIAKGYIVDRGLELLSGAGIEHALINAGGDIGILGPKPDGSPWRIGVKHPRREGNLIAVIPWSQKGAVVTSGDYERFFEEGGTRYHHILDPGSGYPARALLSATVAASTVVEADALATAIIIMGPERGLALVESLSGVEALLITHEFELLISSGLQDQIELPGES